MFGRFARPRRTPPGRCRVTQLGLDLLLEGRWSPAVFTGRTWTITSVDVDGTSWTGSTLLFTQEAMTASGLDLEGYFDWLANDGTSGRELFTGFYTASDRGIDLTGYELVDPNGIALAHYTARLDSSGNAILDGAWDGGVPGVWSATAPPTNTAPVISDVPNQPAVAIGTAVGPIAFMVGDAETPAGSLTLSATSNNTTLVPNGNIQFGGSGANRTVTVTPTAGQSGTATITLAVSDGELTAADKFTVTFAPPANTPPTISDVPDQPAVVAGTVIGLLAFTIGDAETSAGGLTVSVTSSNPVLVPAANVILGGSGGSRTVAVIPAPGLSGTATITLTVTDGGLTASDTFTVTFAPPANTPPTISDVPNQPAVAAGTAVGPLAFTVGDAETPASALVVVRASSNPTLVPAANITISGSGADRTVTVTPTAGQSGTATITLTVTDGGLTASDTFTVTFAPPANTAPSISDVPNQPAVAAGTAVGPLAFTVGDAETPASALVVVRASSNPTLVPAANITISGSGADRTVTVTPTAGQSGTATITLTVTDGGLTAADTFTVTVNSPPANTATPFLIGGASDGSVRVLTGSLGSPVAALPGLGVNARTAVADVTGDGVPDYIAGAGPGSVPRVVVLDGTTGAALVSFGAFEDTFTGGVFVAAADIDGDGRAEVVVTPDESGGPVVAVYRGAQLAAGVGGQAAQLTRFFGIAGDPNFRGGCRPALGDVNGDGAADLVVSAGVLGGPRIAVFDGRSLASGSGDPGRLVGDFFAFEDTLRNGAFVAAGDVTGDGSADLAFGGGPGGAPRVRLFDGKALLAASAFSNVDHVAGAAQRANFFAGDAGLRGGVRLALHDADGDGRADLAAGSGAGEGSRVRVYRAGALLTGAAAADVDVDPFGTVLPNGVFVG